MERITEKMLRNKVDYLNELMGTPKKTCEEGPDGRYRAQIGNYYISGRTGNYYLSGACGGVCLHQITNSNGDITIPPGMPPDHVSRRELYAALCGFIGGITINKSQIRGPLNC